MLSLPTIGWLVVSMAAVFVICTFNRCILYGQNNVCIIYVVQINDAVVTMLASSMYVLQTFDCHH